MATQRQFTANQMAGQMPMMTPKDIWQIVRRHIWLIIILTMLGAFSGVGGYLVLAKYRPTFRSHTFVEVLSPDIKDPMQITSVGTNEKRMYGHRVSIAGRIRHRTTLMKLLEREEIQKTKWFNQFGENKGSRLKNAIKDLEKRFGVSPSRDGDTITLSMVCRYKYEAPKIVNEMIKMFLASHGESKRKEIAAKMTNLKQQQTTVQREIDDISGTITSVREKWDFIDLKDRDQRDTATLKLDNLELERNSLNLLIQQAKTNIETLQKQATGPVNEQIEHQIENDPVALMLAQRLVNTRTELAAKLTKFGENHDEIRRIREHLERIVQERLARKSYIAEQTRQSNLKNAIDDFAVLNSRSEELTKMLEKAAARKKDLEMARVEYEKKKVLLDERQAVLDDLKLQVEKMKMMYQDPDMPKIRRGPEAPVPLQRHSPSKMIYIPGGTMLGFMFAMGLAFLIELLNDLLRTPRDIVRHLNTRLLAVIPDASEDRQLRKVKLENVVGNAPYSIVSESYRQLRTTLKLADSSAESKVFLISSPASGDGKTSVAANLAMSLVSEEKKVLLIDANFWRPAIGEIFANKTKDDDEISVLGLGDYLEANASIDDIITSTNIDGLAIIPTGTKSDQSSEKLGGDIMKKLIADAKGKYDYVIIDGPPVLLVSDTKMLAKLTDGTIMVCNANLTTRGVGQRVLKELNQIDAVVTGCVLFAAKSMKGGYFQEQFRLQKQYQNN